MNTSKLQQEQHQVSHMMIKYGGSFAVALGNALSYADDGNALTIKSAFPELWKQFMLFYKQDVKAAKNKIAEQCIELETKVPTVAETPSPKRAK